MTDQDTSPEAVGRMAARLCTSQQPSIGQRRSIAAVLSALSAERDALSSALEKAVLACGEQARARGEAEGKLAASEMAGVVDGWKARAEAAEAERDALRAQVERAETALKWYSHQVSIMSKPTIDAGWALDRLKADRGAVYAKYLKSRDQKETRE